MSTYHGGGGGSLCIGNSKPGPKEFNKIRIRTSMQEEKATTTTIFIVRNTKNKIVKKRKEKTKIKTWKKGSLFYLLFVVKKHENERGRDGE